MEENLIQRNCYADDGGFPGASGDGHSAVALAINLNLQPVLRGGFLDQVIVGQKLPVDQGSKEGLVVPDDLTHLPVAVQESGAAGEVGEQASVEPGHLPGEDIRENLLAEQERISVGPLEEGFLFLLGEH